MTTGQRVEDALPPDGSTSALGLEVRGQAWFPPQRHQVPSAQLTDKPIVVPQGQVNKMLGAVVRVVADLPIGSTPDVVWSQPPHELLVRTDRTRVKLSSGLIRVQVRVGCDQVRGDQDIEVPLAVGTVDRPAGLVMSTFEELDGPTVLTGAWSDSITAFAWETLLELCRRLAAAAGTDERGRPLIPGLVAATSANKLIVHPMARHRRTVKVRS
jgi:hypothetical protein